MTTNFRSGGKDPQPYPGLGGLTFDQPNTIIGSGMYCFDRLFQARVYPPIEMTGPCVTPHTILTPQQYVSGASVEKFISEMKQRSDVFSVPQNALSDYAQTIVQVARIIKESKYDVILCPLRGARLPGLQADIICKDEPFTPFDGVHLAQGTNDARILSDLRQIITNLPASADTLKIAVLDTARGGDSCREFARLLKLLNTQLKSRWDVDFHLIYGVDKFPRRSWDASNYSSKGALSINIQHHKVVNLLVEDEVRVLGYDLVQGSEGTYIVRVSQVGQIMVYNSTEAKVFQEAPFDEMMIAIVGAEVADEIRSLPDVTPVNLDPEPPTPEKGS
jgi:hypothetical protein